MKAKILIVEDNEMNRDMISRRLERKGYEVILAIDGEEGIKLALDTKPQLILMDMNLPQISGWDATKKIKESQSIPIIALTANAMKGDRERALESGCDDYEAKPLNFESLLNKIESLLNKFNETVK